MNMLELIGRIRMDSAQAEGALDRVTRGTDGLNISSRKAEHAVKNFASIIRSGQEPVTALADSVGNLTRAFGLGVGASVAVVGVVEVIKSFIAQSDKLNQVADSVNSTLRTFQANIGSMDFSGATKQVEALGLAFSDARSKILTDSSLLARVGKTIADAFFGGSEERAKASLDALKTAQGQARYAAETASSKDLELKTLQRISPLDAKKQKLLENFSATERELMAIGASQQTIYNKRMELAMTLGEIERESAKIAKEKDEERQAEMNKIYENETRKLEEQINQEQKLNDIRKRGIDELFKGMQSISQQRMSGAGGLLTRISEAAQTLGLGGVSKFIERGRAEREKTQAQSLLGQFGIDPFFASRGRFPFGAGEKMTGLLDIEAESKRQADEKLFNSVYGIEQAVMDLRKTIEDKLGVPILRSAAGT